MKTRKLFQENVYLSNFISTVQLVDGDFIALAETAFFPTGGGQSCDRGTINGIGVSDVFESDGVIWHKATGHTQKSGDIVSCTLDWSHRFDNMQRHCGEHIMSGVWHKLYGGINRGFHMGEEYMTADIDLSHTHITYVSQDMIDAVENQVNEIIWQNLPVVTRCFKTREAAASAPVRKEVSLEKDIRIVSIGDISNPSDCVACCGTHPSTSAQVGIFKIFKVEKNKGMHRVYFDAGKRAFLDYRDKSKTLASLYESFSAGQNDIIKKVDAHLDKYTALSNDIRSLRKTLKDFYIESCLDEWDDKSKFNIFCFKDLSVDFLKQLGKDLLSRMEKGVILASECDLALILLSKSGSNIDCGNTVNALRSNFTFKGGGGSTSAQMIFESELHMKSVIDALKNQNF